MSNIPLIIMAAGVSSRMKKSSSSKNISKTQLDQSNYRVKGYIQVGERMEPLIYYLIKNAINAEIKNFYIIISDDSKDFQKYLKSLENKLGINLKFAFQDFYGQVKPSGTSDAIFQTMNQYKELMKTRFLVCNCDNLYSANAMELLKRENNYNSMIAYDYECLDFSQERLSSFSILKIENNFLSEIIEKPDMEIIRNNNQKKYVSMNIFSFIGSKVYKYLKDCPVNKKRGEKELPSALQNMILDDKESIMTFPLCEHVPDMTYKEDIERINNFLN
ncbi:sugar phosphate nucleotidyltransferase [Flavobacteriaceae bacterium]|nr:sugar phosphate nucleotidyltransferase [Flavobacteriaceae bacterium]